MSARRSQSDSFLSVLETISLRYASSGVTLRGLIRFVRNCPVLKHFDLAGCECLRPAAAISRLLVEPNVQKLLELMLTLVPELPDMKSMEKLLPLGRIVWLPMTPEKEEPFQLICPLSRDVKRKGKPKRGKAAGKKKGKKRK
ncbi:hypothetical protein Pmar_PMAR011491 [Perkinsus marinus ATCC 50983]|uniref:Uncharacterized protein n=1 Tax=Perkinsus marinus (strain ATCC 50983 / TXsc) TaxID=423536 RepID=C5LBY6_PERM5|nr:hypothetical protein Pmar_PMAR011491 [Perkinsus marinus ATCC 50983]EER05469.1 hypothetical protein Pmar_PMAR011491 [Perkinsus marinus ATCC 50983]|eukprot:XP_002773653.1 hypothetical protein Pmar_PMAR011491 [Perkinsus marinus ATCC 50983]